jgi:iron complex transport system substrate-binding protein
MRIVSLLASATELICTLGAGDELVGRSHECDDPSWVKRLPSVSAPTFDIAGSSREIDARVREKLRAGLPLYSIDESLLVHLAPDILITQTHCEVCAVAPGNLSGETLCRQQVVELRAGTLGGILGDFLKVGQVVDRTDAAEELVARLRTTASALREKTRHVARKTVACLEWVDPIFCMGNWGPELVDLAGGENVLGSPGEHSTTTPWEQVRNANPEVLVIAPCGFGIERTLREMHFLTSHKGWMDLRAVRSGRVYVADGNRFFNRSGPSVFESAEILAEILHPTEFSPQHRGASWLPYASVA